MARYYWIRGTIIALLLLGLLWAIQHKKDIEEGFNKIPTLPSNRAIQYEDEKLNREGFR